MAKGVIMAVRKRSEAAMQPADANSVAWFRAGAVLDVEVYEDPNLAAAHGPGLFDIVGKTNIASGTVTLGEAVFKDFERLNEKEFYGADHRISDFTCGKANSQTKGEWKTCVDSYMQAKF